MRWLKCWSMTAPGSSPRPGRHVGQALLGHLAGAAEGDHVGAQGARPGRGAADDRAPPVRVQQGRPEPGPGHHHRQPELVAAGHEHPGGPVDGLGRPGRVGLLAGRGPQGHDLGRAEVGEHLAGTARGSRRRARRRSRSPRSAPVGRRRSCTKRLRMVRWPSLSSAPPMATRTPAPARLVSEAMSQSNKLASYTCLMALAATIQVMRVLVVEDEADLADAIARGLRREGYAVDVAYDGDEAVRQGERQRLRRGLPRPEPAPARRHRGGAGASGPTTSASRPGC